MPKVKGKKFKTYLWDINQNIPKSTKNYQIKNISNNYSNKFRIQDQVELIEESTSPSNKEQNTILDTYLDNSQNENDSNSIEAIYACDSSDSVPITSDVNNNDVFDNDDGMTELIEAIKSNEINRTDLATCETK